MASPADFNAKIIEEFRANEGRVGTETIAVQASEACGEERDRLFEEQKRLRPQFAEYEQKTGGRVIPVVVLTPTA